MTLNDKTIFFIEFSPFWKFTKPWIIKVINRSNGTFLHKEYCNMYCHDTKALNSSKEMKREFYIKGPDTITVLEVISSDSKLCRLLLHWNMNNSPQIHAWKLIYNVCLKKMHILLQFWDNNIFQNRFLSFKYFKADIYLCSTKII